MTRDFNDDLRLAHRLADSADAISLHWFGQGAPHHTKADGSPVTIADLEIERQLSVLLQSERPFDIVFGEELSNHEKAIDIDAPTWVVDPIDHTRHFARGDPNYGTLIALFSDGEVRTAVVTAPSLGLRWSAVRQGGAYRNGSRVIVSTIAKCLGQAYLAMAGHREWVNQGDWGRISALMNKVAYICGTEGGFLPAMKVACAQLDAFVEPWGALWDHAALTLIVEEAGGRTSTLTGDKAVGGSLLASNGILHDELLDYLNNHEVLRTSV